MVKKWVFFTVNFHWKCIIHLIIVYFEIICVKWSYKILRCRRCCHAQISLLMERCNRPRSAEWSSNPAENINFWLLKYIYIWLSCYNSKTIPSNIFIFSNLNWYFSILIIKNKCSFYFLFLVGRHIGRKSNMVRDKYSWIYGVFGGWDMIKIKKNACWY